MAVIELTTENFESTIQENPFVVVDYWAPWCGPCRSFAPVYEKVSNDHDNIVFAKVNTEQEQQLAAHFQIRSIPTLMIFRDQVIIFSQAGALPEAPFRDLLSQAEALDMDKVRADMAEQQAAANNG
ncbi:thioredoxin [Rhabdochromatium marinum]|uniref:thioredoxin n=1 Tax=Rhabdochromatium marinum TaxID=48729 RepID=UPI001908BD32|nr:thioredoxin [Rhabdochromatium marinum]MBK1648753.1 thioredoxin [Rhabdochromatium marinum]